MDDSAPASEVAAFIKAARSRMGKTLEAFGFEFNCTKANVHAWEKGLHEPPYGVLLDMSRRSGVPLPGTTAAPPAQPAPAADWPLAPFITAALWDKLTAQERAAVAWEARKALDAVQAMTSEPAAPSRKRAG